MPEEDTLARRAYRNRTDIYREEGDDDAPTVVFAHGTLMDRTMFDSQIEAVADAGYHAVAYNLRARTEYYEPAYDLYDVVGDCDALLDNIGVDSCVLVGMSLGGFMGLRFALEHQDRLDGLVLVDSMAGTHEDAQIQTYDAMVSQIEDSDEVPEGLARTSADILFGDTTRDQNPELVESWVERWLSYPPMSVVNEVRSWLHRDDITDRMDEIEVPVLALHGEEDTSIPVERGRETVEQMPDGRLEVVPEAGHSSNDENRGFTNEKLLGFLDEVY
ncbi:MAG: alpha/beta hydrolase [Halobacteriales archaeon]|nr:alpha/beta hydrolase [Halobacteriales archaeon]